MSDRRSERSPKDRGGGGRELTPTLGKCSLAEAATSDSTGIRLVSVSSLGLVVVSTCRRLDQLLESFADYADANDLTWIE